MNYDKLDCGFFYQKNRLYNNSCFQFWYIVRDKKHLPFSFCIFCSRLCPFFYFPLFTFISIWCFLPLREASICFLLGTKTHLVLSEREREPKSRRVKEKEFAVSKRGAFKHAELLTLSLSLTSPSNICPSLLASTK